MQNKKFTSPVVNHIPHGRENAEHLESLCSSLSMAPTAVKGAIRKARKEGVAILSGREGYWISDDPEEIERFTAVMKSQAIARFATTKALRKEVAENGRKADVLKNGD